VTGWLRRLVGRVVVPPQFGGKLDADENVLAIAELGDDGGHVVATSLGLWLPEPGGVRRVGWHLISKATWSARTLTVVEAQERDTSGGYVLIADLPARRFALHRPDAVPRVVHARVTGSIRSRHHRELPGGGAWFVQRRVPGVAETVLQVRADPGTDAEAVRRIATEVAERVRAARYAK
jgi:hypothetical protein